MFNRFTEHLFYKIGVLVEPEKVEDAVAEGEIAPEGTAEGAEGATTTEEGENKDKTAKPSDDKAAKPSDDKSKATTGDKGKSSNKETKKK